MVSVTDLAIGAPATCDFKGVLNLTSLCRRTGVIHISTISVSLCMCLSVVSLHVSLFVSLCRRPGIIHVSTISVSLCMCLSVVSPHVSLCLSLQMGRCTGRSPPSLCLSAHVSLLSLYMSLFVSLHVSLCCVSACVSLLCLYMSLLVSLCRRAGVPAGLGWLLHGSAAPGPRGRRGVPVEPRAPTRRGAPYRRRRAHTAARRHHVDGAPWCWRRTTTRDVHGCVQGRDQGQGQTPRPPEK